MMILQGYGQAFNDPIMLFGEPLAPPNIGQAPSGAWYGNYGYALMFKSVQQMLNRWAPVLKMKPILDDGLIGPATLALAQAVAKYLTDNNTAAELPSLVGSDPRTLAENVPRVLEILNTEAASAKLVAVAAPVPTVKPAVTTTPTAPAVPGAAPAPVSTATAQTGAASSSTLYWVIGSVAVVGAGAAIFYMIHRRKRAGAERKRTTPQRGSRALKGW